MKKSLLVCLLMFSVFLAGAQTPLLKELKLVFNGKSMPVTCFIMDKEGVLWLGNQLGVFTYNGYQLKQIYEANRLSKEVVALYESSNGRIWAGTRGGNVLKFYNYQLAPIKETGIMPTTRITSISQDMDGNLWFATMGEGVFVIHLGSMYNFSVRDGLADNNVYCLLPDYKGAILCGTDKGISCLAMKSKNKRVLKTINKQTGMPNDSVRTISYFGKSVLIIGTEKGGALLYYENKNKFETLCESHSPVSAVSVIGNEIWVGTTADGIINCELYPKPLIRNLELAEKYGIVRIQKILNSPFYIQLVLAENKLYVTQGKWLQRISLPDEVQNPNPRAIATGGGYLYAVFGHGLFKRSLAANTQWQQVFLNKKINLDSVSSIVVDQYENLWVSSLKFGLYGIDNKGNVFKHMDASNGLLDNCVFKLKVIGNTLYYGSKNGLGFIHLNENSNIRFEKQIYKTALVSVFDLCLSKDSLNLWLGTDGKGIMRLSEKSSSDFLNNFPADKRIIHSLDIDGNGNVWYTSLNYGLYRLNSDRAESVNYMKHTSYSAINSLFTDTKGNIVTIHDDFISIYDPKSMQSYSQIVDFGFTSIDYSSSMFASADKSFYMMSKDGIYVYEPERFSFMQNLPAFIHSIGVNLQAVQDPNIRELNLDYDENHLNIQLYTPWYGNHDKIKYMYVLEGLNSDTVITADNDLYFPNLPSGSYTLKVRPLIIGSVINTKWSQKKIVINKPWFKTVWFIVVFALTGFIILYFINYNFLKNQNRSNEIERQRLRQEIKILNNQINPHFLFNSLNNLISIIDIDIVNAKIYTAHLADFYRLIVAYKDNYVITLEEDLKISRIFIALQNIRFSDGIIYKVNVPESCYKCYLPPLTLQILVENAIKHNKVSQSQPLNIDISVEKDYLIVKNNISPKENLETSTKSGIRFIVDRFDFVTKAKPLIIQTSKDFIVKIPLIYTEPLPV